MRRPVVSNPVTIIEGWSSESDTGQIIVMLKELGIEYTWDNSGTVYPDLSEYGYDLVMLSGEHLINWNTPPISTYYLGFYDDPDGEEPYEYIKTKTISGMKAILDAIKSMYHSHQPSYIEHPFLVEMK
jgi:hypothetical protein